MTPEYPNDADGEALRRIANDGSDMNKPMDIDFHVAAPNQENAEQIAHAVAEHDFEVRVSLDDETDEWTVWCTRRMVPGYEAVLQTQAELNRLSKPYDGYSDGWGSFGNCDEL